ncbi:MAG TPA: hypothetical protein VKU02_16135 [Gemmataceae bacterium]|nr:hypothetical protein [Gemmataceae bacterium]
MIVPKWSARSVLLGSGVVLAGLTMFTLGGTGIGLPPVQAAAPHHPHIHKALNLLRDAKRELEQADHIFGGYRSKAIRNTEDAIANLEKARKYAD